MNNRRRIANCTLTRMRRGEGHHGLWSGASPVSPRDYRHGTSSPLKLDGSGCRVADGPGDSPVIGNRRSHIFYWPGRPDYNDVAKGNRVEFANPAAADAAGYRPALN